MIPSSDRKPDLNFWIKFAVREYLLINPQERVLLKPLFDALDRNDDLGDRKTVPLHVTAGAIVVDEELENVLLIHNRALNIWVQPGGHMEQGELPPEAAVRELEEECGLKRPIHLLPESNLGLPLDINIHWIPANRTKKEKEHFHCDFRFLFRSVRTPLVLSEESLNAGWIPFGDKLFDLTESRMLQIISKLDARLPLKWRSKESLERALRRA
jgi:8-oxo-dGTP pyrophosphatase MutT (NUDIX family)